MFAELSIDVVLHPELRIDSQYKWLDCEQHYDIDGVSEYGYRVVVASDALSYPIYDVLSFCI